MTTQIQQDSSVRSARSTRQKIVAICGGSFALLLLLGGVSPTFPGLWLPLSGKYSKSKSTSMSSPSVPTGQFSTNNFRYNNVRISEYRDNGRDNVAGKLVVVTAIATNIGKESDSPYLIMKLQDSQGNKFAKAAAVYQIDAPSGSKATDFILPGQTRNIQLGVFDVAPDAMGLKLVVQDGFKELEVDPMP